MHSCIRTELKRAGQGKDDIVIYRYTQNRMIGRGCNAGHNSHMRYEKRVWVSEMDLGFQKFSTKGDRSWNLDSEAESTQHRPLFVNITRSPNCQPALEDSTVTSRHSWPSIVVVWDDAEMMTIGIIVWKEKQNIGEDLVGDAPGLLTENTWLVGVPRYFLRLNWT